MISNAKLFNLLLTQHNYSIKCIGRPTIEIIMRCLGQPSMITLNKSKKHIKKWLLNGILTRTPTTRNMQSRSLEILLRPMKYYQMPRKELNLIIMDSKLSETKTVIDTTLKTLTIYSKISSKPLDSTRQMTKLFMAPFEKIVRKNMDLTRCSMIKIFGILDSVPRSTASPIEHPQRKWLALAKQRKQSPQQRKPQMASPPSPKPQPSQEAMEPRKSLNKRSIKMAIRSARMPMTYLKKNLKKQLPIDTTMINCKDSMIHFVQCCQLCYFMDFTQFITSSSETPKLKPDTDSINAKSRHQQPHESRNLVRVTDPYIRRYHIIAIILSSSTVALGTYLVKSIVQNIKGKKFYKFSPWLQLTMGVGYWWWLLGKTFPIIGQPVAQQDQQQAYRNYQRGHYFNSQYWH